jgi:DNA-binding NtrC family response regulator
MTPQAKHVLLVDDEEKLLKSIAQRMKILGFTPHTAVNGHAALEIARKQHVDLAIVDLQMPDMDGLVVITKLKEIDPHLRTVLLTGHGNEKVRQATESLNTSYFEKEEMGDFWHFVRKLNADGQVVVIHPASTPQTGRTTPVTFSPSGLTGVTRKNAPSAVSKHRAAEDPGANRPENRHPLRIVGETPAMQELRKGIARAASIDCTVSLKGEPGTGKELAARAIHAGSRQAHNRFLLIDCANFQKEQLTRQLLGFAGLDLYDAIRTRSGIFGPDPVGTLLFDQVEKMPEAMQQQLLAALRHIEGREPSQKVTRLEIRIIVATQADLNADVKAGTFRKDLVDRLQVFELTLPPLRACRDDIHPLCRYFFDKFRRELGKSVDSIAPEVVDMLVAYDFPGNVSELKHIIERAVIIADGKTITRRHLPARFLEEKQSGRPKPSRRLITLAELERGHIAEVLEATKGNKSRASEILGISRAALWRKLKQVDAEKSG